MSAASQPISIDERTMMNPKELPDEVFFSCIKSLSIAFSGVAGALIRQINTPEKTWSHWFLEWICGAFCALYGARVVAYTVYHLLTKNDLLPAGHIIPEELFSFAGFLCGAVGISVINALLEYIKFFVKQREH